MIRLIMALISLSCAALWLLCVVTRKKCTDPVEATLIGCKVNKWNRTPIVRYTYDGIQYETSTINVLSKGKMRPLHQKRDFIVYVNPNKPRVCTVTKNAEPGDWLLLLFALIYLFLSLGNWP